VILRVGETYVRIGETSLSEEKLGRLAE